MKKFALSTLAAAMLASPSAHTLADAYIGSQMTDKLLSLSPTESLVAVVTYEQMSPLAESQVTQLLNLGITEGIQFKNLPIIGVVATKDQIEAIAQFDGVRSVFANREMSLYNADAREITGVADLQGEAFASRNNAEFTGNGSTVLVIDSGIDASHQDHFFGDTVVDNVQAILNPGALSIVGITGPIISNQVNTDLNSGHGTHVTGTIAGTGVMSDGKHRGAAPDADIIGYGSGAAVLLLDTIGGFDYAISKQYTFDNPIKVISNSWGSSGKYEPLGPVSLARYAVMGGAVRQYRDLLNDERPNIGSVPGFDKAFVESVMVKGGALKDKLRVQAPVLRSVDGSADPFASVTKLDIAYSLVQMLGLEEAALSFDPNADIVVDYSGEQIVLEDQDSIPADMKGYVQLARSQSRQ